MVAAAVCVRARRVRHLRGTQRRHFGVVHLDGVGERGCSVRVVLGTLSDSTSNVYRGLCIRRPHAPRIERRLDGSGSQASFTASAGTTYVVRVAGYYGDDGTFDLPGGQSIRSQEQEGEGIARRWRSGLSTSKVGESCARAGRDSHLRWQGQMPSAARYPSRMRRSRRGNPVPVTHDEATASMPRPRHGACACPRASGPARQSFLRSVRRRHRQWRGRR